jgi:hypothetical protein
MTESSMETVPTQAGVYLLWMKLAKDDWRIFFVGSADSLVFALRRHMTAAEPNLILRRKVVRCVTGFEYSVQPDPEIRPAVLKYLAEYFKPECGATEAPPGIEAIEVNLPD